jgi:hypothetical protein
MGREGSQPDPHAADANRSDELASLLNLAIFSTLEFRLGVTRL